MVGKFINTIVKPTHSILSLADRRRGVMIVFLMIFQALLDFVNISVFVPLLGLIANPDFFASIRWLPDVIKNISPQQLISIACVAVLSFALVKHLIVLRITQLKAAYAYRVAHDISTRILREQLSVDYETFSKTDYSKEVNRVANQPLAFANNIVIGLTTILSEGLIGLMIVLGVAIFDFRLLSALLLVLAPIVIIYSVQRKKIKSVSEDVKIKYPQSLKYAWQALEGWIDIKSSQREEYFFSRFKKKSNELAETFTLDHFLQISASRLTELFATIVICAIIFWSLLFHDDYQRTLILLAVYAGASFRLLPSINRILNALIQIKSHEHLLEELKPGEPKQFKEEKKQECVFNESIRLESFSFSYPDRATLFEKLELRIVKGEKVAIIGKSGGGKTSLLLLLLGLLRSSKGKIFVDEVSVVDEKWRGYQKLFSYVSQNPYLLDASIKENVAFVIVADDIDTSRVEEALREADLKEWVDQLPQKMETSIGERGILVSGGQRQRLALARALYANREILVLDEVTSQLDKDTEEEIIRTLQKIASYHRTIVMVTHHEKLLPLFDRVFKLENGELVAMVKG